VVYCRSWCPDCRRAKVWLEQNGIPFEEVDVDADPEARERAAGFNEGRLHTPTFQVGEGICVDFKPDRIKELLDLP
jgi:glutaredoxin